MSAVATGAIKILAAQVPRGRLMWILIDMSYLAHRARHSMAGLATEDMQTGVLYGFFEQLYTICSTLQFSSNKVIVFADSKTSYRTKDFPEYKLKRKQNRTPEEWEQIKIMHAQIDILRRQVLPEMGIHVYGQKGLESDDLMAWAAARLTRRKKQGVMITSDGDLYQCITPWISWYDPQRELLYSPASFVHIKGVRPDQWGLVKAIGGCTTDGVPGIQGVSEKGAIDYLLDKIPHHHKRYKNIICGTAFGEIERWKKLVVLPHKRTKRIKLRAPKYNPEVFFEFCKKYNIDSYLEGPKRRQWEGFFENRFRGSALRRRKRR